MRGIPIKWRTEISTWEPPFQFVDQQLKGPYTQWIHTHTFTEISPNETLIHDEVRYRLPLAPAGALAWPLVSLQLRRIFDFRARAVARLLGAGAGTT